MPWNLARYYGNNELHFITCSCYRRQPLLGTAKRRDLFLRVLELVREKYQFVVIGYVVMPEHFHLLIAAAEARSDPSDPTNGAIHFFVLDVTPGRNEDVPSWAQGREAKLGPFTAGANDSNADIHKGDTIFVLIDPGP